MITGFESHVQNFVHQGSSLSKEEFRAQLSEISKSLENVVHERDRRVDEDLRELQQRVTRCISREDLEKALRAQYSQIAQRSDTMEHSMVSLERFWKAEFKKLSDEKASAVAVEEALSQKVETCVFFWSKISFSLFYPVLAVVRLEEKSVCPFLESIRLFSHAFFSL